METCHSVLPMAKRHRSHKKASRGDVLAPYMAAAEAKNSNKTEQKCPPNCLPPTGQSEENVTIAVPSLPPMIPTEGPVEPDSAAAIFTRKE
eukprot:15338841-Ditylum_brightwellii.AAC.1